PVTAKRHRACAASRSPCRSAASTTAISTCSCGCRANISPSRKISAKRSASGSRAGASIFSSTATAQARRLEMDEALVGQYIAGLKQVQKKYRLGGEVGIAMLTPMTELFHVREVESDPGGERTALLKALGAALKKLERSREREGAQLKADMEGQIEHIGRIALAIEARAAENGARAQKS